MGFIVKLLVIDPKWYSMIHFQIPTIDIICKSWFSTIDEGKMWLENNMKPVW